MGGLFSTPKFPEPKPVRMPTKDDPQIRAARQREVRAAQRRGGRESTFLTDALKTVTGSSGQRYGG